VKGWMGGSSQSIGNSQKPARGFVEFDAWLQGVQFVGRQEEAVIILANTDLSASKQFRENGKVELVTC